jgi:hypothetical protein
MGRQLALLLDSGVVIHDPSWRCIADVMFSFHGFGSPRCYGVIVDAETLVQIHPPVVQSPDSGAAGLD